jgi:hypothetical protein
MQLDGSVVTTSDGSKVDLWAMKSLVPQFSWESFLQELEASMKPPPQADTREMDHVLHGLKTATAKLAVLITDSMKGK